ncbi:hypothetical protein ES703_99002 [subsurface metagenome]
MNSDRELQPARYSGGQGPDYNLSQIGELLPGVLEAGRREKKVERKPRKKLSPTNSERLNRAFMELGKSAFMIHILLWKWRGAPAKGLLPFFTIHSLSRFCRMSRPTVREGLQELECKGWIRKLKYNKHAKNALYRLIPIRDVPLPG